ncbi:MAG: DUF1738 domain-containing protein [Clostridia bacterium]|nr:DUF1738 domain-containing protein [Clostridia bacterium]
MIDIYAEITNRVIAALESGVAPWRKPWVGSSSGCISYATGKQYSILNTILLGGQSGEFITYKGCMLAGGHVRKGEKARMVVFWRPIEKVDEESGEITRYFYLKHFSVFHLSQCEGVSPRWAVSVTQPVSDLKPDAAADAIVRDYIDRCGVRLIVTGSDQAFYRPGTDEIVVPQLSQYKHLAEFYSTEFHEMVHSTGHHSRLNRINDVAAFGSHEYSREELTAELGAAFLVNSCGLETADSFCNSASYLAGWLKALKNDKKLLVAAAGAAEKAVSLILNRREGEQDVADEE